MSQSQCPACKGTGYIRIGLTTQPCEACHTRGHLDLGTCRCGMPSVVVYDGIPYCNNHSWMIPNYDK
jgi:hypothetical protein